MREISEYQKSHQKPKVSERETASMNKRCKVLRRLCVRARVRQAIMRLTCVAFAHLLILFLKRVSSNAIITLIHRPGNYYYKC